MTEKVAPFWTCSDGTQVQGRSAAVLALMAMFDKDDIPPDFTCEGQLWPERAEAWVMHAIDQLEAEIESFKECGDRKDKTATCQDTLKDKKTNLKSEWIILGEMRLHVPSVVVGGLRLVLAAFGTNRPYRDEIMQAWFDGFGALLATNGCGLSQQEASEYMRSTLATLLPHASETARKSIMKSISEVCGESQERRTAVDGSDLGVIAHGPAEVERHACRLTLDDFGLDEFADETCTNVTWITCPDAISHEVWVRSEKGGYLVFTIMPQNYPSVGIWLDDKSAEELAAKLHANCARWDAQSLGTELEGFVVVDQENRICSVEALMDQPAHQAWAERIPVLCEQVDDRMRKKTDALRRCGSRLAVLITYEFAC